MLAVVHCLRIWRVYLLGTKFVVRTDNVANTYFQTQKKLSAKQARWQEFLASYDFVWEHKAGRHNQVADALSIKVIATITQVHSDLMDKIKTLSAGDAAYQKLMKEVKFKSYGYRGLHNNGTLQTKGGRTDVPSGRGLRRELMRECHDAQWAGHPGAERMFALMSRSFYSTKIEDDIEVYVKTCLVCQQDKVDRQREAGLLQPLPIPARPWTSVSMDFVMG